MGGRYNAGYPFVLRGPMRNLLIGAFCLSLAAAPGCNQERNKSIELMNQGVEMGRQKLYDRAINELKQSVQLDPSNAMAYYNLGVVYKDMKKWPEAADAFAEAVKLEGDNPSYRYELGYAYEESKRLDLAKSELEAALKL